MRDPARHKALMAAFDEACDLEPAEQAAYLARLWQQDEDLAGRLAELLEADGATSTFDIDEPVRVADADKVTVEINGYRILRLIGRGGMGLVYEAEQPNPRRRVALKLLRAGWDSPTLQQRLAFEAQVLARLDHPGIARLYEVGVFDEQPFLVMELVEGRRLDDYVEERRLDVQARAELLVQVADAVHHAHMAGFVHRDLKPANILVEDRRTAETSGPPRRARVLDFGIARALEPTTLSPHTVEGAVIGTPAYMSPEQTGATGEAIGPRSDVYSLGVIAYELIARRAPYEIGGKALWEVARVVNETEPPPPSRVSPGVSRDLDAIVLKAMAKEPERRYESAAALAEDLRNFLEDRPVKARRPSAWYRLGKFARRRRALFGSLVALFMTLLAASIVSINFYLSAEDARVLAESERGAAIASNADLLLRQARSELEVDPTRAVAWLHTLGDLAAAYEGLGVAIDWTRADEIAHRARGLGVSWELLDGHGDVVRWASLSPSGALAATASYDHTVRIWDLERHEVRVLGPLGHRVAWVAWAPHGRALAAVTDEQVLHVWGRQGGPIAVMKGVEAASWAPRRAELAIVGSDGVLRVLDGEGAELQVTAGGPAGEVERLSWSPDGLWLAGARVDGRVQVWRRGQEGTRSFSGHRGEVSGAVFVPVEGRLGLVSAGVDGSVRVWSLDAAPDAEGQGRVLRRHEGEVKAVAFSGTHLATASRDGVVMISEGLRPVRVLRGHEGVVRHLAFSPDGRLLATAGDDQTVRLWWPDGGVAGVFKGHSAAVRNVAWAGGLLVSGSSDASARVWRVRDADRPYLRGHRAKVLSVAASEEGRLLVSADEGGVVRLWDRASGASRVLTTHTDRVYRVDLEGDRWIATAGREGVAQAVDLEAGRVDAWAAGERVRRVDIAPGGAWVAVATAGSEAVLWSPPTGATERLEGHTKRVHDIRFLRAGGLVATTSDDQSVRLWSAETGAQVGAWDLPVAASDLVVHPSEPRAAAGSGGEVVLFDAGGVERRALHEAAVSALAWGADGRLYSGGRDGQVRVSGGAEGQPRTIGTHGAAVLSLAVLADGTVVSGGADRRLVVWRPGGEADAIEGFAEPLEVLVAAEGAVWVADDAVLQRWPLSPARDWGALARKLERLTDARFDAAKRLGARWRVTSP